MCGVRGAGAVAPEPHTPHLAPRTHYRLSHSPRELPVVRVRVFRLHYVSLTSTWLLTRHGDAAIFGQYGSREEGLVAAQELARQHKPCRLIAENEEGIQNLEWTYGNVPWEPASNAISIDAALEKGR